MGIFSQKKSTPKAAAKVSTTPSVGRDLASVLVKPRVTEKAMQGSEKNVYTFEVSRTATKYSVRDAIAKFYGVTPVKVNIVNKSPRQFKSRMRGRTGVSKGMKKAYVYLKKGDSISLV